MMAKQKQNMKKILHLSLVSLVSLIKVRKNSSSNEQYNLTGIYDLKIEIGI